MLKKDKFKSTIKSTVGQPIADIIPPENRGEGRERMEGTRRMKNARMIQIDKIKPDPDQPRKTFNQELLFFVFLIRSIFKGLIRVPSRNIPFFLSLSLFSSVKTPFILIK